MQDQDIAAQIRDTFPQLSAWGDLLSTGFTPQPGTPLAQDEAMGAGLSTTDIAWQGLGSGVDHLKGFGAWFGGPGTTAVYYQMATFSLLRGALVGGALACWVLTSDDVDVRMGRSLTVAAEWHRFHLNWLRGIEPHANDRGLHDARVAFVQQQIDQVQALRKGRLPKGWLNNTNAINDATDEIWPGDAARAAQVASVWQAGSGNAHALGWPLVARQYDMEPLSDGRFRVGAPSLDDVATAYFAAYDFVEYGFHRLIALGA